MALGQIYQPGGFHQGLKAALSCLGICSPTVSAPLVALDSVQMMQVEQTLGNLGLL